MTTMLPERTIVEKPIEVQILERAAELLEEFGWVRGTVAADEASDAHEHIGDIHDGRFTRFCFAGAIWRAAADLGYASPVWDELRGEAARRGLPLHHTLDVVMERVGLNGFEEWEPIVRWNDTGAESKEEVTTKLRSLAMERMPA